MRVKNKYHDKSLTFKVLELSAEPDLMVDISLPDTLTKHPGPIAIVFTAEQAAQMRDWLVEHVVTETKTVVR